MLSRTIAVLLYGAAALAPAAIAAQQGGGQSSPTNSAAPVPAVTYESGFSGYVPFREEKLAPWRSVNDEVGRVGGHIGIVRGATALGGKPAPQSPVPGAAKK